MSAAAGGPVPAQVPGGTSMPGEPWPRSARRDGDGVVHVAGVDVREVAAEHGTPAYLVDEADMRGRARAYRTAFETAFAEIGAEVDVYYAGKAFLSTAVARWMHAEGLRIDTASGAELLTALRAGVPGADIGLHGNNKSDAEIARALDEGVGRIIVDSLAEIERVADAAGARGVTAPVMVRVTTGVHAGGHEYIATAHEDQKFGLSVTSREGTDSPALAGLLAVLARPELTLQGIHSHIGSQILDASGFAAAAHKVLELRGALAARTGVLVDEVDLGGGYGIAYLPGEVALDPDRVAKEIATAVADVAANLGQPLPRFSIEPGRSIAGPPGTTLYTVGTIKPVRVDDTTTRLYVSVDGGMSDNVRPALYGAAYHAEVASRLSTAPPALARVVGKHCESGDIVVHDVWLPADVRAGDLLLVAATGAYGRSMASNYNLVPRPPVVALAEGGTRVLVRRETEDDLLGLDVG